MRRVVREEERPPPPVVFVVVRDSVFSTEDEKRSFETVRMGMGSVVPSETTNGSSTAPPIEPSELV